MRRINLNWLPGLVGVASLVFLTGANGEGCGGEPPPPPEPPCPPGEHLELVCNGMEDCNEPCVEQCVPDQVCPEGYYEEYVCDDPMDPGQGMDPNKGMDPTQPESICLDPNGCPPEPGGCYSICVPINPCGEGYHEEYYCSEPMDPSSCMDPMNCQECYPICVPDNPCDPGYHEEWVCQPSMQQTICLDPMGCPEPPPEECYPTCVPDECTVVCDEYMQCWEDCSQPPKKPPMGEPQ